MAKVKKIKKKTHKGLSKVLKVRPDGTISRGRYATRHNTGKKSAKRTRKDRTDAKLSSADKNRLKKII